MEVIVLACGSQWFSFIILLGPCEKLRKGQRLGLFWGFGHPFSSNEEESLKGWRTLIQVKIAGRLSQVSYLLRFHCTEFLF